MIDLIFLSVSDEITQSGVVSVGVGDHMLILVHVLEESIEVFNKRKTKRLRLMKDYSIEKLLIELKEIKTQTNGKNDL